MKTDIYTGRHRNLPVILVIALILSAVNIRAQSSIENTSIKLVGNKIQITYDIANSKRSDRYDVRLEVTDSTGNPVSVKSLEGDIGEDVSGGNNKKIIWDLETDNIQMNADIFFELYANAIVEPDPSGDGEMSAGSPDPSREEDMAINEAGQSVEVSDTQAENLEEEPASDANLSAEKEDARKLSRTGIFLQSLALPGLGLSRLKSGPHWLRGVAGYGSVVGAVVLNNMAISTYDDYRTPGSAEEAKTLLDKSTRQDNISEICAYAAIGIWVSDLVWTIIGTSDLNKSQRASVVRPVSIGTEYDPLCGVPLLAIRYNF